MSVHHVRLDSLVGSRERASLGITSRVSRLIPYWRRVRRFKGGWIHQGARRESIVRDLRLNVCLCIVRGIGGLILRKGLLRNRRQRRTSVLHPMAQG